MRRSFVRAASFVIIVASLTCAVRVVALDDFVTQNAAWWEAAVKAGNAYEYKISGMNGKKSYGGASLAANVDAKFIKGHADDHNGTGYAHVHFQDTIPKEFVSIVDAFWDYRFGVDAPGDTARSSNAVLQNNCFSYALDTYTKGTYDYWLEPPSAPFNADTKEIAADQVAANDILWYDDGKEAAHASVVKATKSFVNSGKTTTAPRHLEWKYRESGVYLYTVPNSGTTFDTPAWELKVDHDGTVLRVGNAMDTDWGGAGTDLVNDKVRRKK